jgi:hypothetical protein
MLGLLAAEWTMQGCARALAEPSIATDRAIDLTVYKADFAEVRDTRKVELTGRSTHVELRDVSKTLDPKSVIFEWPGQTGREITANTYDLGVGNGDGLLKRFVGHDVEFVWRSNNGSEGQRLHGTLETADNGIVLKVGDKYYVNPDGTIIAPSGDNLVTTPTLSADVQSDAPGTAKLRRSYLSQGLNWSADYVGIVSPNDDSMNLECWATVTNRSGVDYPAAHITLVTGSPNVMLNSPQPQSFVASRAKGRLEMADFAAAPVAPAQAVGELYSYEIRTPSTIGQDQMNRVKMMSSERVPIIRDYSVNIQPGWGDPTRQNAQMAVDFYNRKEAGLGKPLPEGAIRVYESSGDRQAYVGGSTIGDVPKGDKVELTLSDSIDVYARSTIVRTKRIDKHKYLRTYHSDLYNEKAKAITLRVVYETEDTTSVVSQSAPSVRKNNMTLVWKLTIPGGQHIPLDFTLQSRD